jgi:hypothetical protein
MDAGFPVCWADLDAMGSGELLARLRALGVPDDTIARDFLYFEPSERLIAEQLDDVRELIAERGARLFVIDAFNPMLNLHGLDPNSTADVETFWREVASPLTDAGAAPTLLDHVTKNPDGRGKYAIGSERKASGAIVHLGFKLLEPFTRDGTGRTVLQTHKDRPGFLPRPTIGQLVLESNAGRVSYRLDSERGRTGDAFRPTRLMEKVSAFLEASSEAMSQRNVEQGVHGRTEAKRTALRVLVEEGYAMQTDGPRNSKLYEFRRAYREADDDYEPSSRLRPDCAPTAPPTLVSTPSIDCAPAPTPIGGRSRSQAPSAPNRP